MAVEDKFEGSATDCRVPIAAVVVALCWIDNQQQQVWREIAHQGNEFRKFARRQ